MAIPPPFWLSLWALLGWLSKQLCNSGGAQAWCRLSLQGEQVEKGLGCLTITVRPVIRDFVQDL